MNDSKIIVNILAVLFLIARAVLFSRNGISAWKSFIPFYGEWIFAKDIAKTSECAKKILILNIVVFTVALVFGAMFAQSMITLITSTSSTVLNTTASSMVSVLVLFIIFLIVVVILSIMFEKEMYDSYNRIYGHEDYWTWIAIFIPVIAYCYFVYIGDGKKEDTTNGNQ